jgi:predicted CoA-binding protein
VPLESDAELRSVFTRTRTIAVLGAKSEWGADAWNVPRYLERAGYTVRAVNPKLLSWGDAPAWPRLAALPERVDLIDVFRAEVHLPGHVDEILALPWRPHCVWFQLGIRDDSSAARLEAAGIAVVQDRCAMTEHRRLQVSRSEPQASEDHEAGR